MAESLIKPHESLARHEIYRRIAAASQCGWDEAKEIFLAGLGRTWILDTRRSGTRTEEELFKAADPQEVSKTKSYNKNESTNSRKNRGVRRANTPVFNQPGQK